MRSSPSSFPFIASGVTALGLVVAIFLLPDLASAEEAASPASTPSRSRGSCSCPQGNATDPRLTAVPPALDIEDEIAALESLQIALSKVADGSSYVWHRSHGRLSGVVRPTSSFKDLKGQVCRHITVVLSSPDTTKRTETIACRLGNGVWEVDG